MRRASSGSLTSSPPSSAVAGESRFASARERTDHVIATLETDFEEHGPPLVVRLMEQADALPRARLRALCLLMCIVLSSCKRAAPEPELLPAIASHSSLVTSRMLAESDGDTEHIARVQSVTLIGLLRMRRHESSTAYDAAIRHLTRFYCHVPDGPSAMFDDHSIDELWDTTNLEHATWVNPCGQLLMDDGSARCGSYLAATQNCTPYAHIPTAADSGQHVPPSDP